MTMYLINLIKQRHPGDVPHLWEMNTKFNTEWIKEGQVRASVKCVEPGTRIRPVFPPYTLVVILDSIKSHIRLQVISCAYPIGMSTLSQFYLRLLSSGIPQLTQQVVSLNTIQHGVGKSQKKRYVFLHIFQRSHL